MLLVHALICSCATLAPQAGDPEPASFGISQGYLDTIGQDVSGTIGELVGALRTRTRRTAQQNELTELIRSKDYAGMTRFASETVLASDLVDIVAIFDADGVLLALNDINWQGQPFPKEDTQALLDLSFDNRDIISSCLTSDVDHEVLEFQTTCDFTPRLFGSSGLSIALTTPVNDASGERIGAISTRLRFERLTERLHLDLFEEDGNRIWLVSDYGEYFDEAVNRGELKPPIPSSELKGIVQSFDFTGRTAIGMERDSRVMRLFAVPSLGTLEGGGVRVLLDASGAWVSEMLAAEQAGERLKRQGFLVFTAILSLVVVALTRSRNAVVRAQRAAERANHSKSSFLASTSHEIRTPMAAILGYAELLGDETRSDEACVRQEALAAIRANGTHLMTLIGDILDLSKIEDGSVTLDPHDFCPEELIRQTFLLIGSKADEQETTLELTVDPDVPAFIHSDGLRIRQILLNLLGNAIRFTPKGRVGVAVHVDGDVLSIEVADSGKGMNKDALSRIFNAYEQADRSTFRRFGGTGLGLTISRQLCLLMGGDLTATSQVGVGSSFIATVRIEPAREAHDAQGDVDPSEANAPEKIQDGSRILIVDDTTTNLRLLGLLLSRDGAEVTSATNGVEALDACRDAVEPFDLILMDAQMPVMDGSEAFLELRRRGVQTPIVVLTADALTEARKSYLAVGFDDYATKPISRADLRQLAAKWIRRGQATGQREPNPPSALPASSTPATVQPES